MNAKTFIFPLLIFAILPCLRLYSESGAMPVSRDAIRRDLVLDADGTWRKVTAPDGRYGCRNLFTAMLSYCESNTNLNRVAVLIEKAETMQERNPENRRYGNFFWYVWENEVLDANAVDFCMQHAALLWMFHREKLDPRSRERFLKLITIGMQGLMNHIPSPTYTNIALLNASDLILLGQALGDKNAVQEGARRLALFLIVLREQGVHEYTSPTYYGINMESALLLEALVEDSAIRNDATIIRRLFEHDIALNRQTPNDIIAGTCSRTYDFLYMRGELDQALVPWGWMKHPGKRFHFRFYWPLYSTHLPDEETTALSSRFPRTVRQRWGSTSRDTRIHYLCKDVTLGTSASNYGKMDIPLAVNLPDSGDEHEVQLYFLPDGRDDPYGKKRIAAGNHNKALHLTPWWAASQIENEALAMVLYNSGTFQHITDKLQSHIVFRRGLDGLYIDNRKIDISTLVDNPQTLNQGQALFLREGSAAVAIRIPWSQGQGASSAAISILDDRNKYGALRLSINHEIKSLDGNSTEECAGAIFHVKVGSGIITETAFEDFRNAFINQKVQLSKGNGLTASVKCGDRILSIGSDSLTFPAVAEIIPQPSEAILSMNGEDLGSRILDSSSVIQKYLREKRVSTPIDIKSGAVTTFSSLDGASALPFEKSRDGDKDFLWVPEVNGRCVWNWGSITCELNLEAAGIYRIEAEVLAPTPEDDSFYVSLEGISGIEIIPRFAWSTGTGSKWRWSTVTNRDIQPAQQEFKLPAGKVKLIFHTREAGTKISRVRITPLH